MARFGNQETSRTIVSREEDVLSDLHADFRRSKVELIQRFLQDQVELNKRFSEYALNSDEETDGQQGVGGPMPSSARPHHLVPMNRTHSLGLEVLEDVDEADWASDAASVASAVASSAGSDAERDRIALSEDDFQRRSGPSPAQSTRSSRTGEADPYWPSATSNNNRLPLSSILSDTENIGRVPDLVEEGKKSPKTKAKKVLVKKNVRPRTAVGVRSVPLDKDDLELLSSLPVEGGIQCPPSSRDPSPVFYNQDSFLLSSNRSSSSPQPWWEDVKYYSTGYPVGRIEGENLYGPMNTSRDHVTLQADHMTKISDSNRERKSGIRTQKLRCSSHQTEQNINVPQSSTYGNRSVLSIDIPPSGRSSRSSGEDEGALVTFRPTLSARGHQGKRVLVKAPMSAPLKAGMVRSSKRPIAVLKLPPLDSASGTRGVSDQQALVNPANKGAVVSTTEFLAG